VVSLGIPSRPARTVTARGNDDVIGVVVDEVGDPFFASVIGEIERMALDQGMTVIIASTRRLPSARTSSSPGLLQRRVAGLIIASTSDNHADLKSSACPVLFIDRAPVDLDAERARRRLGRGAMAVDHLVAHCHRRIAYVGDRYAVDTARSPAGRGTRGAGAASIPRADDYVVLFDLAVPTASRVHRPAHRARPARPRDLQATTRVPRAAAADSAPHRSYRHRVRPPFGDFAQQMR
jgi:LacI family transcriptional regulator